MQENTPDNNAAAEQSGLRDRLMDFSRPVGGAYYYAPPLNLLADLPTSAGLDGAR